MIESYLVGSKVSNVKDVAGNVTGHKYFFLFMVASPADHYQMPVLPDGVTQYNGRYFGRNSKVKWYEVTEDVYKKIESFRGECMSKYTVPHFPADYDSDGRIVNVTFSSK